MKLDIIIVTYNSQKWMKDCIGSIENQKNINLQDINLICVDNKSKDNTIEMLEKMKINTKLGSFQIFNTNKNLGFGKGNNYGFDQGKEEFVLFLNPDTKLDENCIEELYRGIKESGEEFAAWEMRQKPYEHPKTYDILTGETEWASGACVTVKRDVFKKIGKFDKKIFMYAEDVDISYKIRALGYKIKYLPHSTLAHYCYGSQYEIKPVQYVYSLVNNLNLKLRYGTHRNILGTLKYFFTVLKCKGQFKGSRIGFLKALLKNTYKMPAFYMSRFKYLKFKPTFIGVEYSVVRQGSFVEFQKMESNPLVSIVVRTCARPAVLMEALTSIMNQTYKNIEVIIVEDGKNTSEEIIKRNFQGKINYKYFYTDEKKGRCFTANLGLEKSTGKYLNFLDDDDLFFQDHVETLVSNLEKNEKYKIAYTYAFMIGVNWEKDFKYEVMSRSEILLKRFSKIDLFNYNLFPIQAVMFEKSVYLELGGIDLEMQLLEDWELWQRYAMEYDFLLVPKTTSEFKVPHNKEINEKRGKELHAYLEKAHKKIRDKKWNVSVQQVLDEVARMNND